MIFRRMKRVGLNWIYHFPRIETIDLSPLSNQLKSKSEPEWADYSPSEAIQILLISHNFEYSAWISKLF